MTSSTQLPKITTFGTCGKAIIEQMERDLKDIPLYLSYDSDTQRFTILNSQDVSVNAIEKIFAKRNYTGYFPKIESSTDEMGNKMIKLEQLSTIEGDEPYYSTLNKSHDAFWHPMRPLEPSQTWE